MDEIKYFQPYQSNKNCAICFETMQNEPTLAHTGGGELHPLHKKCIEAWLTHKKQNLTCPVCRDPVSLEVLRPILQVCPKSYPPFIEDHSSGPLLERALKNTLKNIHDKFDCMPLSD